MKSIPFMGTASPKKKTKESYSSKNYKPGFFDNWFESDFVFAELLCAVKK